MATPFRQFQHSSVLPVSAQAAFDWHVRPGALQRLLPPWEPIQIVEPGAGVAEGSEVVLRLGWGKLSRRWRARHRDLRPGAGFVDEQVEGPFSHWRHSHRFDPMSPDSCRLTDDIEFMPPFGWLGTVAEQWVARPRLERQFRYRHAVTAGDLRQHARWSERPRLHVALTGASGLVGTALRAFLTTGGHQVTALVRGTPRPGEVRWDPASGVFDATALEGIDAVVHLAGEPIAAGRWNPRRRERIRSSRVEGTALLARGLAGLRRPPSVLVSASATGYYGDRGDEILLEGSGPGRGFLADVAVAWEGATGPAEAAGIRVVHLRQGVVLTPAGGALGRMLPAFRLGLAGRLGHGRQYFPWISLDDALGVVHHALQTESLRGPVNAVAPDPVSNAEFTAALGQALRRPTLLPVPGLILRLALGDLADEALLASARVRPDRLEAAGFAFRHPTLSAALAHCLGR